MRLWALIVIVSLSEALLHYFPWRKLLRGKELPRLAAYTLGLLGMMIPLSAWLWERNEMEIIQTLWIVIITAGVVVFALYGFDHYLHLEMRNMEADEREAIARSVDGKKS